MKKMPTWIAAVALSAAVSAAVPALGQSQTPGTITGAQRAQQNDDNNKGTKEERQAAKRQQEQEQQANRQERREQKREREQLNNMPEKARKVLRAETQNAQDVDYFRVKGENQDRNIFGATFTNAEGKNMDLRVDRQGNVISRTDLTAQAAATAAAQQPAPAQPAPTPAPAPAPAPGTAQAPTTPAPAPTAPTASADQEAPKSGDPVYRRLQATELPQNIRTVLDREAQNATDVKYYRTKYRGKMAYEVKFTDAAGTEKGVYVNDAGEVVNRRTDEPREGEATPAGARESADANASGAQRQAAGRVEMDAVPKQAQTQLRRLTEGGKDVKLYRTRYGKQDAFQAKFTSRDGKDMSVYVDENGKILSQKEEGK
jgi:hypothetical protein